MAGRTKAGRKAVLVTLDLADIEGLELGAEDACSNVQAEIRRAIKYYLATRLKIDN